MIKIIIIKLLIILLVKIYGVNLVNKYRIFMKFYVLVKIRKKFRLRLIKY
jgi:hypothetical protein